MRRTLRWTLACAGLLIAGVLLIGLAGSDSPNSGSSDPGASRVITDERARPGRPSGSGATKLSANSGDTGAGDTSAGDTGAGETRASEARAGETAASVPTSAPQSARSSAGSSRHSGASLWRPAGEVDWPRDRIRGGLVSQAEAVLMTPGAVARLSVGDRTFIEIPQAGGFTAIVDATSVGPNGDRSWQGHLTDGSDYSVTFTAGEAMSFATILTPKGTYLLEATGEQGWIFRDELDQLIDASQSDFVSTLNYSPPRDDGSSGDDFLSLETSDGQDIEW